MSSLYCEIENGFILKIDMTLYAREAVFKAFYQLHNDYLISYERKDSLLLVWFEYKRTRPENIMDAVSFVMKELDYWMLRYDTMKETASLRELLVGRALYATCVETETGVPESINDVSWEEDKDNIFKSWEPK